MTSSNATKPTWIDCEVHLFPRSWCDPHFRAPESEAVLNRVVFDHVEREEALAGAHLDGLIREMDRSGIQGAVIMGLPWLDPVLCDENNQAVADAVRLHPDRLIGVGVLPPPDRVDLVDAVVRIHEQHGLRGVKVIPAWQGWRLDDPILHNACIEMARRGLVLIPHTDHPYLPDEGFDPVHRLYTVARNHPELKIAAPHLGGLLAAYGLHEPVRETLRNVLFIGTVPKSMPMIRWAVEAVGADHVAFGTDFPFNPSHDQKIMRQQVEEMGFTPHQLARIAGLNTLEFFGVKW